MTLTTAVPKPLSKSRTNQQKFVLVSLWVAMLLALAPRLQLGIHQFIHYDGYWHVFIASQNRLELLKSEWRGDAHPILYYLLLRGVSALSHSHLAYRSLSIGPSLASVYLLGLVAQRTLRHAVLVPLAAAAFGLSITIIDIAIDVRGYALALMFIIWTFLMLIDLMDDALIDRRGRLLIGFGILNSLAIATEYYAVFFTAACWGTVLILALTQRAFCRKLSAMARQLRFQCAAAVLFPTCTFFWLYLVHLRYQPHVESNVLDFYWDHHRSAFEFVTTGMMNDLNFMLPVEIKSAAVPVILLALGLGVFVYAACKPLCSGPDFAFAGTGLVLLLLTGELVALGLMRRYPFGGYARQQSVLFPFMVLSAFVVVDRIISAVPAKRIASWTALALAAAILWSFDYQWQKFPKVSTELFTSEFALFRNESGCRKAVYVDQFSLIAYYIHTHAAKWKFRRHVQGIQRADTYQVSCPDGRDTTLLRNLDSWNFDLSSPAFYAVLADLLQKSQLPGISLFFVKQGGQTVPDKAQAERRRFIAGAAARFGLAAKQIVLTQEDAFVTFEVR